MAFRLAASARAAGAIILLLLAPAAWSGSDGITVRGINEPALVFSAANLKGGALPSRIVVRNAPHVFANQVVVACLGLPLQPQDLLLYFIESRKCERLPGPASARRNVDGRTAGLFELSGIQSTLERELQTQAVVVLQPQVLAPVAAGLCICRGSESPMVSVEAGSGQTVVIGEPIQTVVFAATDVDSVSLSHEFSWTLDGGGEQPGLPGALAPSCLVGVGTLDCSIDGSAPLQPGFYEIIIVVDDGLNFSQASASLTVTPPPPELIFQHGFEDD